MAHPGAEGAEGVEQSNQPALCTTGCGFFANPACNNMCSKCYRDSQMAAERAASGAKAASAALADAGALGSDIKEAGLLAAPPRRSSSSPPPAAPLAAAPAAAPSPRAAAAPQAAPELEAASAPAQPAPPARAVQKNPGRCFVCNKKVGLTGFKCRCEYVFCGAHRLAEAHECSVDYKGIGRARLAESNPLVQAAKIHKV